MNANKVQAFEGFVYDITRSELPTCLCWGSMEVESRPRPSGSLAPRSHPTHRPRDAREGSHGSLVTFPSAHHLESAACNNLPVSLSSFVGRERKIAEVRGLVEKTRLLTLTGPGGCGKTRLALAVVLDLAEGFEDGVCWVDLASLSDHTLVSQAVVSAMEVRETPGCSPSEAITDHLKARETLLVRLT